MPETLPLTPEEASELAYLEEQSALYAASRTPKLDAGYAEEDPGDGRPDRLYGP